MQVTLNNGHTVKRHFFNGKDYHIDEKRKVVELTPEFKTTLLNRRLWGRFGYKKVGGSSLGGVLGSNSFETPFLASTKLMWLGEPMYDPKYVDAGQAIEPHVIKVIEQITKNKIDTFPAEEFNYDYFSAEEHIGGLPDAVDFKNKKTYEIKTTGEKNIERWDKHGVPEYYKQQVCVYDYLIFGRNDGNPSREVTIVACFLKPEDYSEFDNFNIKDRRLKTYKITYTKEEVMKWITTAEQFRENIMLNGTSLPYDNINQKDREALEYLRCKNEGEFRGLLQRRGLL